MRRSRSSYEKKPNKDRRRSWFNGPFFNMFSSEPPSPEQEEITKQRPSSFIEDLPSLRPKIYRILSKAARKRSKPPSLEIQSSQENEEIQDDLNQRHLLKQDDDEADRIQLKNDLVKLAFEGEFSLPFDYKDLNSGKILDVGCGPGSWCIDLAQKYPNIQVCGVDNVDMFPLEYTLPANCQLLMCDVLNGLSEFSDSSFDVIHIRFMVLSLTTDQYLKVVKDCWRLLKPGGYIEVLETDLIVYSAGPLTQKMNHELIEIAISKGFDTREQANMLNRIVPEEGVDKQVKYRSIPIGVWGGRIGVLCRDDMINILTKFQKYYNTESQSFEQDISAIIREMDQYKSFSNYYFYSAQKPNYNQPINTNNNNNNNTNNMNKINKEKLHRRDTSDAYLK